MGDKGGGPSRICSKSKNSDIAMQYGYRVPGKQETAAGGHRRPSQEDSQGPPGPLPQHMAGK